MGCCHAFSFTDGGETAFSVDVSALTFGPGVLAELGAHATAKGLKRVALFTDKGQARLEHITVATKSLKDSVFLLKVTSSSAPPSI